VKVLLFGANGQVGFDLKDCLPKRWNVLALNREQVDLTRHEEIRKAIREFSPDVVINAAAYTNVDGAQSEIELAHQINSTAIRVIAEEVKKINAWCIHYSTDYVFDGRKEVAYTETDEPCPINVYGESKLCGEQSLITSGCNYLILRISWVYSTRGHNFIKTMLSLCQRLETFKVVADQFGAPTSSKLVAATTSKLVEILHSNQLENIAGIYHLAPAGRTSWHDYAKLISTEAGLNGLPLRAQADDILAIKAVDYPVSAPRPYNSILDSTKLATTFGICLPRWEPEVKKAISQIISSSTA
jgi:dTDP-4-dehydrorhamnose reductase